MAVRTGRQHPRDVRSAAVALCGGRWLITVREECERLEGVAAAHRTDDRSIYHIQTACLVLASYRVLTEQLRMDHISSLNCIRRCLVADGRWPAFIHSLHSRKPEGPGSEEGKCKGPWCVWRCVLLRR